MSVAKNRAVSFNPDDLVQAGLADDFDGEITEVRYVPWDYDGHLDHHILAARVVIVPEEDSGFEEFTQHYSAGDLQFFLPSADGEDPVDLEADDEDDMAGPYVVPVGRRESLANSSNWAAFVIAAVEAGFPKDEITSDARVFEGVRGHFNRVAQPKRGGIQVEEGEGARRKEILVLTVVEDAPKKKKGKTKAKPKGAAAKSKAKPKSKAKADEGDDDDLAERLSGVVLEALADAEDMTLSKAKLPAIVIKSFEGAEKAKAVKLVATSDFLESGEGWEFDADEGTLTIG
jgi:hypothetical protein